MESCGCGSVDFDYSFDARCFFQIHVGLLDELVRHVVGDESGDSADDLFCGVGLFTLPLSRRFDRVRAVDSDRLAIRFARNNARRAGLDKVSIDCRSVEAFCTNLRETTDLVVVDPPRHGLARPVRQALVERAPQRLTYVSCQPATLARDLRQLTTVLEVVSVTFLDLFPQTGHLETVVRLRRR